MKFIIPKFAATNAEFASQLWGWWLSGGSGRRPEVWGADEWRWMAAARGLGRFGGWEWPQGRRRPEGLGGG